MSGMIDKDRFSVGIIGAGEIVATAHLPVLLAMEEVSVAWLTDANLNRAKSMALAYRVDHLELPESPKDLPYTDVVLLAIPYGARDPYYEALSNNSRAIYAEKPFARRIDEHQRICSLFPDYQLACGFQRRSWGPTLQVKKMVEAGFFGQLRSVNLGFGGPGIVAGNAYCSDISLAGGGILMETGVHSIDALLFILNATAIRVHDARMIMDGGFDLHADAKLALVTGKDVRIECEINVSCLQETINCLEFTFDHVVVSFNLFGNGLVYVRERNGSGQYTIATDRKIYPHTSFETFYEHWSLFLNGVRTKCANLTSASQSILTTEVIEKLYEKGREAACMISK